MMKNIVVLTGSHRKNGNSDKLAESFIKGAAEKGHIINKIDAAYLNINDCLGCNSCWTKTGICIQQDDISKIHPILVNADVIVFVSPLYFYGMSAKLRCVIDRMYAYCAEGCEETLKIKECALLMCGECDSEKYFSGAVDTYLYTADYMKWMNSGVILVPGVLNKDDIANTDGLARAYELGLKI